MGISWGRGLEITCTEVGMLRRIWDFERREEIVWTQQGGGEQGEALAIYSTSLTSGLYRCWYMYCTLLTPHPQLYLS